jgi:hypothetical protein
MAEIRKYDPAAGTAIAQALKAAMGEPVRPVEPGSRPEGAAPKPEGAVTTTWLTVRLDPPDPDSPHTTS